MSTKSLFNTWMGRMSASDRAGEWNWESKCGSATYLKHNSGMNKCTFGSWCNDASLNVCITPIFSLFHFVSILYLSSLMHHLHPSLHSPLQNFNQNNSFYVHINEQIELCLEFNIAKDGFCVRICMRAYVHTAHFALLPDACIFMRI